MKKLAITLLSLVCLSCLEPDAHNSGKMTIHSTTQTIYGCLYTVHSVRNGGSGFITFQFEDDCGKFAVGDTITIIRKTQ